jgi:hypothetical protein
VAARGAAVDLTVTVTRAMAVNDKRMLCSRAVSLPCIYQGPGRSTHLMCGGGVGDSGVESTLHFSGRVDGLPLPTDASSSDVDGTPFFPFVCGNLVVGTISGTPRPPACGGVRPAYSYNVLIDEDSGCEAAGRWVASTDGASGSGTLQGRRACATQRCNSTTLLARVSCGVCRVDPVGCTRLLAWRGASSQVCVKVEAIVRRMVARGVLRD